MQTQKNCLIWNFNSIHTLYVSDSQYAESAYFIAPKSRNIAIFPRNMKINLKIYSSDAFIIQLQPPQKKTQKTGY